MLSATPSSVIYDLVSLCGGKASSFAAYEMWPIGLSLICKARNGSRDRLTARSRVEGTRNECGTHKACQ